MSITAIVPAQVVQSLNQINLLIAGHSIKSKKTGEFCLIQKKKCAKVNNWEKLRRAEIDIILERVRQCWKQFVI